MNSASRLAVALVLIGAAVFASSPATAQAPKPATSRVFELPGSIGTGDGKEVSVLMDESHLKLVTVALHGGTMLPSHRTPVPVTVQVLDGEGVIHIAGEPVHVSRGTIVSLAAGEEHDVVPVPGTDMMLLVHYLRSGAGTAPSPPRSHDH